MNTNWNQTVNKVKPYVVKVKTPQGSGTGFLSLYNWNKSWCGIATAYHVVRHADEWQQPIKIIPKNSKTPIFLENYKKFVIFPDHKNDSAIIFFKKPNDANFPKELIKIRPQNKTLDIGSEVGWLGHPYLEKNETCFFSGCISARNEKNKHYLLDGVVINGVSGGPVLYSESPNNVEIIGIVTAYIPNRATGSSLPGLSLAQDVHHLHKVVKKVESVDEAIQKKQELEVKKATMVDDEEIPPKK